MRNDHFTETGSGQRRETLTKKTRFSLAGGTAIAETIFGFNSPSGRLTQTFYSDAFTTETAITDMAMRPAAAAEQGSASAKKAFFEPLPYKRYHLTKICLGQT